MSLESHVKYLGILFLIINLDLELCHQEYLLMASVAKTLDRERSLFRKRVCNPKHSYIKTNFPHKE